MIWQVVEYKLKLKRWGGIKLNRCTHWHIRGEKRQSDALKIHLCALDSIVEFSLFTDGNLLQFNISVHFHARKVVECADSCEVLLSSGSTLSTTPSVCLRAMNWADKLFIVLLGFYAYRICVECHRWTQSYRKMECGKTINNARPLHPKSHWNRAICCANILCYCLLWNQTATANLQSD